MSAEHANWTASILTECPQLIEDLRCLGTRVSWDDKDGGSDLDIVTRAMIAIERLYDRVEADRWIPVTERLPDRIGDYLVSNMHGQMSVCDFHQHMAWSNNEPGWTDENGKLTSAWVTHWRPLPEPPKEEPPPKSEPDPNSPLRETWERKAVTSVTDFDIMVKRPAPEPSK